MVVGVVWWEEVTTNFQVGTFTWDLQGEVTSSIVAGDLVEESRSLLSYLILHHVV